MNAFRETRRRSRCSADLAASGLYLLEPAVAILVNLWHQAHSTDEPHEGAVDSAQYAAIGTS